MTNFILIHAPMLGPETVSPLAAVLRRRGHDVQTPDVLARSENLPKWSEWPDLVARAIDGDGPFVLVAHSAATPIAAALAKMANVSGLVIVDGFLPPVEGWAAPSEGALLELIQTMPRETEGLPLWVDWWKTDTNRATVGISELAARPELYEWVVNGLPRLTVEWFDDKIDLPIWRKKPAGFVRTSHYYDISASEAERLNWPIVRLDGTHLHLLLEPEATADAILSVASKF